MSKDKPARKPYPSDLTDAQWTLLAPMLPAARTNVGDAHAQLTGVKW
jgi:transposase